MSRAATDEDLADYDPFVRTEPDQRGGNGHGRQGEAKTKVPADEINYQWMTSAELDAVEDDDPYLVDDVLPQAQGGMIGGKFKTLKTAVACDLVLSLATGTPFLGRFAVPKLRRAGIMSSEVGRKVLKKRARAVAKAKGFALADVPDASWSAACPRIGHLLHHDALERDIVDRDLSLLVIDPSYLALCEAGDSATNVFKMGALLIEVTRLIEKTGCSIVLCNHNRKGRGQFDQWSAAELGEVSMSGFAEWARYWLLLGPRQEWDEERGRHWLWLRTGGSGGHGGLFHVDVEEGKPNDPGGRQWCVDVEPAEKGRERDEQRKDQADQQREAEQLDADKRSIIGTLAKSTDGATRTDVRSRFRHSNKRFDLALAELLDTGDVLPVEIIKGNNRPYAGFKLGGGQ